MCINYCMLIYILESVEAAFTSNDGCTFDYVINCAGETKLDQTEAVNAMQ